MDPVSKDKVNKLSQEGDILRSYLFKVNQERFFGGLQDIVN